VRWHAEGEDLVIKAVLLGILFKMALVAVRNEQSVCPPPDRPLYTCHNALTTPDQARYLPSHSQRLTASSYAAVYLPLCTMQRCGRILCSVGDI
jgi:hypothetical protein